MSKNIGNFLHFIKNIGIFLYFKLFFSISIVFGTNFKKLFRVYLVKSDASLRYSVQYCTLAKSRFTRYNRKIENISGILWDSSICVTRNTRPCITGHPVPWGRRCTRRRGGRRGWWWPRSGLLLLKRHWNYSVMQSDGIVYAEMSSWTAFIWYTAMKTVFKTNNIKSES